MKTKLLLLLAVIATLFSFVLHTGTPPSEAENHAPPLKSVPHDKSPMQPFAMTDIGQFD